MTELDKVRAVSDHVASNEEFKNNISVNKPKKRKPKKEVQHKEQNCNLPHEILRWLEKKKECEGLMIYDKNVFENWKWDRIKLGNKNINTYYEKAKPDIPLIHNPAVAVFFPNTRGRMFLKGMTLEKDMDIRNTDNYLGKGLSILSKNVNSNDEIFWIDEFIDRRKLTKPLIETNLYTYMCIINSRACLIYSLEKLDKEHNVYDFEAMHMPAVHSPSVGLNQIIDRYFLISYRKVLEDFSDVAEKRFERIQDLSPVWDYKQDKFIYDETETFIILSSCMFMILGFPAIGLIICGGTRARKSAWLESFARIFKDLLIVVPQQNESGKGMFVTSYGERPSTGLVFNARYVLLLDEFMRGMYKGADKEGRTKALLKNCTDYMNVIEHKEYPYSSGKGTVFATLKSSFIATDNAVFKEELRKAWEQDSASLRRFTFLKVSDETEKRASNMSHISIKDIESYMYQRFFNKKIDDAPMFTSLDEYAKFFRYGRERLKRIQLTKEEQEYIDELWQSMKRKYDRNFPVRDAMEALYICWKFWNEHMCLDKKIYEDAVDRIYWSHMKILEPEWKDEFKKEDKQMVINPEFISQKESD